MTAAAVVGSKFFNNLSVSSLTVFGGGVEGLWSMSIVIVLFRLGVDGGAGNRNFDVDEEVLCPERLLTDLDSNTRDCRSVPPKERNEPPLRLVVLPRGAGGTIGDDEKKLSNCSCT